jgi:dimethylargininase
VSDLLVIAREVSASLADCELTHIDREAVDVARARTQHGAYLDVLRGLDIEVRCLPADDRFPDAVFVEDAALVFEELAVITRPGAASRRGETDALAEALAPHRRLARLDDPATLDGGDVIVMERDVFVGLSSRTNEHGVEQLARALHDTGRRVHGVELNDCLHLKTAACRVGPSTILYQADWVDPGVFGDGFTFLESDPAEPFAANAVWLGERGVIHAEAYPKTRARLEAAGLTVHTVPADELARAEGGVTCCALLVHDA